MRATDISVSFLSPTTVELRLDLGKTLHAKNSVDLPAGIRPEDADPEAGWVWDDGWIGRITPGGTWMGIDDYVASPLDPLFDVSGPGDNRRAPVDTVSDWAVAVDGEAVDITGMSRKSAIRDTAETGWFTFDFETTQTVFFELDQPMRRGDSLEIEFADAAWTTVEAVFDPRTTVSEAIHVNLAGFAPGDLAKVAYLSSWKGRVIDDATETESTPAPHPFEEGMKFRVVDEATGNVVLRGRTTLDADADAPSRSDPSAYLNYAGTDVFAMDFSKLDQAGDYHIRVPGVGRSESFAVKEDHWDDLFDLAFSGFYNQRSGIELTEDLTSFAHPRSLHPEDGRVTVLETTVRITDTNEGYSLGQPDQFGLFPGNTTGEVLDQAWGGWHDAGDWDRRTQHIEAARTLIELHELAPDWANAAGGALPESGNKIPDILDEALWGLRFFNRLMTDEGGVRGGVESPNYAGYGSTSWTEESVLYAYAPDTWTTWSFAAAAAKMAHNLEDIAPKRADLWLKRAEKAWSWAEDEYDAAGGYDGLIADTVTEADDRLDAARLHNTERNIAALELYRATEKQSYHKDFRDTFSYTDSGIDGVHYLDWQWEAAALYAAMDPEMTRNSVAANARKAIVGTANDMLEFGADGAFGFYAFPGSPYGWGATAQQPEISNDLFGRAHHLTGKAKFLEAMQSDVQYAFGANPQNQVFVTGMEDVRTPETILHGDGDALGNSVPPGITLYGDYNIYDYGQDFYHEIMWQDLWPDPWRTPVHESFQAFNVFVPSTEFTVQQGIADMTFVTGYLAAHSDEIA